MSIKNYARKKARRGSWSPTLAALVIAGSWVVKAAVSTAIWFGAVFWFFDWRTAVTITLIAMWFASGVFVYGSTEAITDKRMKLRYLTNLIRVGPVMMLVLGVVYPPILFVWMGAAMLIAALIVYPDELASAATTFLASLGPWAQEAVNAIIQNGRLITFFGLVMVIAFVIAPVVIYATLWFIDEPLPSLDEPEDSTEL